MACALLVAGLLMPSNATAQRRAAAPPPPPTGPAAPADVGMPPADGEKSPSGLISQRLVEGNPSSGKPSTTDYAVVEYTGWSTDGKPFDSTQWRGRPSYLSLERIMKGLSEGIQLMTIGERRRLWVPENIGFAGAKGRPTGMVTFDVHLIDFYPAPTTPPPDVAAIPSTARVTASGLAYRVLRDGTGSERPTDRSRVSVHYTGWTTDGKMFDSSLQRGRPQSLSLQDVIPGWREGVPMMVVGERMRFWVPENIAYKGAAGSPKGMLVFDIELLAIEQ